MIVIAKAAAYLTGKHVPSIGPEVGKHLVVVATVIDAIIPGTPAGPVRTLLEKYRDALNLVTEMACHQQMAVLATLRLMIEGDR